MPRCRHWVHNALATAITRGFYHPIPVRFTPLGIVDIIPDSIPGHIYITVTLSLLAPPPHQTTMSGCTLQLSRNSPLRTILVDEATGQAKYKIDTPRKVARSVTRISKFGPSPPQLPLRRDEDADLDSCGDITNKGKKKVKSNSKKGKKGREGARDKAEAESPEAGDEIARIYWKWFSPHKIVFRGGIITRNQFMPKAGKMGG